MRYVDTYRASTVSELRRTGDRSLVATLEIRRLALLAGVQMPRGVHGQGRDGTTDIWGVSSRAFDLKYR